MMGIQLKPQLEIPHTMTDENRSPAANGARQQIYHHVDAAASTEIAASAQALTPSLGVSDGVALYDRACAALAEAVAIDEILAIRDIAAALKSAAKIAGNREAEANALVLRLRATRRLGQLMPQQAETVGLATGGEHGGRRRIDGSRAIPSIARPTFDQQGIGKRLAQQGRELERQNDSEFERTLDLAKKTVGRVHARIVREVEIEHEREKRRAQTAQGGTVADLHALIAQSYRAGTIGIDAAWPFDQFSERAAHAVTDHYDTMTLAEIKKLPIAQLAAPDCALFMWATWPKMPVWNEVIEAWGFRYSGLGFDWVKLNPNGEGLHKGNGYNTRQNSEPCLLAKRGSPLRLSAAGRRAQ
jgi:hypothetical protein